MNYRQSPFLRTVDLSSSPSDTLLRHDRHLNLVSTLSQSSSLFFPKLTEPLLDPAFPLRSLLSPHSFTDPASSFITMASTIPAFFRRLVETHAGGIVHVAASNTIPTVRVVSEEPSGPHCLDFGRATQNWVVLFDALADVQIDLEQFARNFGRFPLSLLTLLILAAASTNNELSKAAVSVFSNQFGLSIPRAEALLFATPSTFPLCDPSLQQHPQELGESDLKKWTCRSICEEVGCCVLLLYLTHIVTFVKQE
ncbi:hypothetical protein BLNAU_5132 [Blattamonas nauphoetae]|uniref:Uncharacterized protein n=1 Tax=Blattamonas nauphoetae TaxID=2049346 RepID=A0ABQ9Y865_9EUKA|nr:hypothetical protein BLNAU_5132 [Blattamonas nauphoetae]